MKSAWTPAAIFFSTDACSRRPEMAFFRGNRNLKIDLYWELDLHCVSRLFFLSLIGEFYRLCHSTSWSHGRERKNNVSRGAVIF